MRRRHEIERTRGGFSLAELLVSLILTLVVVSIGALSARRTVGGLTKLSTIDTRAAGISDALQTLSRHVANADPQAGDLRSVHDSVLDLMSTIGVTSACRVRADTVVLLAPASAASDDTLPWAAVLPRAVSIDDELRYWHPQSATWRSLSVRAVGSASGSCGDSLAPMPGTAGQRVIISDTLPPTMVGTVIRVLQRERWSLVRSSDGQWSLSQSTWDTSTNAFAASQPLYAPLSAPTSSDGGGFVVSAFDARGTRLADSTLAQARTVVAQLRAPRHARFGSFVDSVRINVGSR